jgi:hypothetical protein
MSNTEDTKNTEVGEERMVYMILDPAVLFSAVLCVLCVLCVSNS